MNHDQLAGLQIADAVASSIFGAVNLTQYGEAEDRYVKILQPTLYRHDKTGARGYGLKFWPNTVDQLLPDHPHLEFIRGGQK